MLLSVLLTLGFTSQALADECVANEQFAATSIGSRCKEDPACVIVGGTHVLEWRSPSPAKIVVVCIHGLGLCARAYKPLAQELSAAGIDGFGVNVRGFGPDRDKSDRAKLNCVKTVDDVTKLLESIRREHPEHKVILIGESMGGAISMRVAAEHPELVDAVVCSAPAWKILKMRRTAVNGVFELFLSSGKHPGPAGRAIIHQATSDPQLSEHWLTDPSHKLKLSWGEATAFLNFISKTDSYAKQLTKPILLLQGLNDHLVSPKAVAKMFKEFPAKSKTFLIDAAGEHLILEEARFTPAVMEKLIPWLKSNSISEPPQVALETVNNDKLFRKEQKRLSKLHRIAGFR